MNEWKFDFSYHDEELYFGVFIKTCLMLILSIRTDRFLPCYSDWVWLENVAVNISVKYLLFLYIY